MTTKGNFESHVLMLQNEINFKTQVVIVKCSRNLVIKHSSFENVYCKFYLYFSDAGDRRS